MVTLLVMMCVVNSAAQRHFLVDPNGEVSASRVGLGRGRPGGRRRPGKVPGQDGNGDAGGPIVQVAAGSLSSMVLKRDKAVYAVGSNEFGQLGDGSTTNRHDFKMVMGGVKYISVGVNTSLFLSLNGTAYGAGLNLNRRILPSKQEVAITTPVEITTSVKQVAAGGLWNGFLTRDGDVMVTGFMSVGNTSAGPIKVFDKADDITFAPYPMYLRDNRAYASVEKHEPQDAKVILRDTNISTLTGGKHDVYVVPYNDSNCVMEIKSTSRVLVGVTKAQEPVLEIASGDEFFIVLTQSGDAFTLGSNRFGQLGDGTQNDRAPDNAYKVMTGVRTIAAGWHHSLFLKKNGNLYACGRNDFGQLGDNSTQHRLKPLEVLSARPAFSWEFVWTPARGDPKPKEAKDVSCRMVTSSLKLLIMVLILCGTSLVT